MTRRKLEELNLLDDFMFGSMVASTEFGEPFCRKFLEIIFDREFGKLQIIPQRNYYGTNTDQHGMRLDVYLEEEKEDASAAIYDIEPESDYKKAQLKNIPQRVRFYHAKIDASSLKSGMDYTMLKHVTVLMIMPFDPFEEDRMVYTIRNMCEEMPDMPYDDGARTIFLYAKGTKGNPPKNLQQLLAFMEHTTMENATTPALQELHDMVEHVKHDEEVSIEYMKIFEREQLIREEGRQLGIESERANTERERKRADKLEQELHLLKENLRELQLSAKSH